MIEDLIKEFSRYYYQDQHSKMSTCQEYEKILGIFFRFIKKDIEEINRKDIYNYIDHLRTRNLAINTIRIYQTVIRMFFQWYSNFRVVLKPSRINPDYKNPTINLKPIQEEIRIPEILNANEIIRMVRVQDMSKFIGRRDAALICLLADTGIRKSEAAALKIGHIQLHSEHFVLNVPRIKSFERSIPFARIDEDNFITGYWSMYWQEMKFTRITKPIDPLFITAGPIKKNTQLNAWGIVEIVKRAARRAQIEKNVTVHSFRHFYGTHMYLNGTSIMEIKELMGHALLETTQRYIHIANVIRGDVLKTGIAKSMGKPPANIRDFTKLLRRSTQILKK